MKSIYLSVVKTLTIIGCLVCCALSLQAQQPDTTLKQTTGFVVQGEIVDAQNGETIPYATIQIVSDEQTPKPVKGMLTDINGRFNETINQKGNYRLIVNYIGKKSLHIPFSTGDKPVIDFGKIRMDDDTKLLNEVVVSAQKLLVKVDLDKITYNMADDPEAKANNVLEMMKKIPMITVDGEENIQLKGSADFKYYINGKPSSMLETNSRDVLRSMPAHTVQTIEVITDPGAKYDAEGVTGIINIVTKKQSSMDGYTASVNSNFDDGGGFGGGLYFSLKYRKIGFTGNLNALKTKHPRNERHSFREDYTNATYHYLTQKGRDKLHNNIITGYGELSYEIDTLNMINISFNRKNTETVSDTYSDVLMRNSVNDTTYQYFQLGNSTQENGSTGAGIDYQRSFSLKNRLLTASYRYNSSSSDVSSDNTITGNLNFNNDHNKQRSNGMVDEHTFQLDYTTPIHEIHTVETGIKYIKRLNESNSDLSRLMGDKWTHIPSDRDKFQHVQDIVAAYAGYSLKYRQWGFKTGVRFEGTWLNAEFPTNGSMNFNADYANLIPSGIFSYQLRPGQTLRGGYSMRLSRPDIWYLNPYRNTSDTLYIRYGNPNLQAVKYHTLDFNYNYFNSKFSTNINVAYNQTNNAVSEDTWIENGISYTTYKNIANAKKLNLAVFFNYSPTSKFRAYLNLRGDYSDLRSNENGDIHRTGCGGSVSAGSQHTLPYDFRLNIVLYYSAPAISLQSKAGSYVFHNFALSKSFMDKKLNIRAITYNPFTNRLDYKTTKDMPDFYYRIYNYQYRRRLVEVTVSYRFGEMKDKIKKVQRGIVNDDVMERENTNIN